MVGSALALYVIGVGADQVGVVVVFAGDDVGPGHPVAGGHPLDLVQVLVQRLHQLGLLGDAAPDGDAFGVKDQLEVADHPGQGQGEAVQRHADCLVPFIHPAEHLLAGDGGGVHAPGIGGGGDELAAAVQAAPCVEQIVVVGVHADGAELAGGKMFARQHLAVQDEGAADAGAQHDDDAGGAARQAAPGGFGQGGGLGVVQDGHRHAAAGFQLLHKRKALAQAQGAGGFAQAALAVDDARHRHGDALHPAPERPVDLRQRIQIGAAVIVRGLDLAVLGQMTVGAGQRVLDRAAAHVHRKTNPCHCVTLRFLVRRCSGPRRWMR